MFGATIRVLILCRYDTGEREREREREKKRTFKNYYGILSVMIDWFGVGY